MKTIGYQTERKKTANIKIQQKIINFIFCLDLLNGRIFQLSDIRASMAMRDIRLIDRVKTTTIELSDIPD